jgi:hypothetical protein
MVNSVNDFRPRPYPVERRPAGGRMRVLIAACAFVVASSSAFAQAPAPPASPAENDPANQPTLGDDKDVIEAGKKWLSLIDDGHYDQTWDLASPILKNKVTKQEWNKGLRDIRKPLGKLVSRSPEKFARAHSLPGAPDGDYVIVEYLSTFANGKHPEQLTWVLENGDTWRVTGYFIR